jgi:hypothetical protein
MHESDSNTDMLRAQAAVLLSQANAQSLSLRRAITAVPGNSPLHARLADAASRMDSAVSELAGALSSSSFSLRTSDLIALEGIVQSGEASTLAGEAAAESETASKVAVATASAATRHDVENLSGELFDQHLFDRYLHFSSSQDEEAFHKRTAATKQYVTAQLARNTAEGNLNAGGGMVDYMLDAHAHGAGASPDFLPRWNRLVDDVTRQHLAMKAAGQSTEEFDRNLVASVRHFLKAKGLSDTEIDRRLAGHADPLEAVKPFIGDDRGSRDLERQTLLIRQSELAAPETLGQAHTSGKTATPEIPQAIDFDAIKAKLKAAGVQVTDTGAAGPKHGLAVGSPPQKSTPGIAD